MKKLSNFIGRFKSRKINYSTYESAFNYCKKRNESSGANLVMQYIAEVTARDMSYNFKGNHDCFLDVPGYAYFSLPLLETILIYQRKYGRLPKIVDFGGTFGQGALYISQFFNLEYSVIETLETVLIAESNHIPLQYFKSIEEFKTSGSKVDLVFSSGAIQYTENPNEILGELFAIPSKMITLCRNNFSDTPIITIQQYNVDTALDSTAKNKFMSHEKNCLIPNTQIAEDKIHHLAQINEFHLYRQVVENSSIIGNNAYGKNLYFMKR
jgi:putative methyltransferase (TIGR04325 family)